MATISDNRIESTTSMDVAAWWRLWAIAALAHVIGNPTDLEWRGPVNAIAGLIALAVVLRPDDRRLRTALVVAVPISAWVEAPLIGNHWWVAAAVSGAALLARPWQADDRFWPRFAPTARLVLLVFYSFAAFAKLNSGFFDPAASCARYFANRTLGFWQLPEIGGSSSLAGLLPIVTVVIELAVPVLLVLKPTRRFGVWLAIAFHLLLTLDLRQHFFDFTLVLIPLFLLFTPAGTLAALDERWPRLRMGGGKPWVAIAAAMVLAANLPVSDTWKGLTILISWILWIVMLVILVRALLLPSRLPALASADVSLRPPTVAAVALVGVVILNGLSPYLELKTATGFNMYANLTTVSGETNHYVVPATAHLRTVQDDLVTVLATDDEDLAEYVDSGFGLPVVNLRDYLAEHPELTVTFEFEGEQITLDPAGDHPEWLQPQPLAVEKLLFFRSVPDEEPAACQPTWLPAR